MGLQLRENSLYSTLGCIALKFVSNKLFSPVFSLSVATGTGPEATGQPAGPSVLMAEALQGSVGSGSARGQAGRGPLEAHEGAVGGNGSGRHQCSKSVGTSPQKHNGFSQGVDWSQARPISLWQGLSGALNSAVLHDMPHVLKDLPLT